MAAAAELKGRLSPDLETARGLAAEANVIPVKMSFTDDCETPVSALLKLKGEGPCFLLESAERGQVGRYSFLGTSQHAVIRWADGELREYAADSTSAEAEARRTFDAPDPYAAVAAYLEQYRVAEVDGLPPFAGGAVGLFGYDLVRTVEPLQSRIRTPSACRTWP